MKKTIYCLIFISMVTLWACKSEKSKTEMAVSEIESILSKRYACQKDSTLVTPGGAVLIIKEDSVLFDRGYGVANISDSTPIDGNTFFNIASVSKQFTAMAVMKLYEDGKLDIDKSIYDINPTVTALLPQAKKPFTDITLRHLMSHSSGIPDERPRKDRHFVLTATDMQSVAYMKDIETLNFTPGTQYEYSNPAFQLLYAVVESVSGKSFEQYMKENIFSPAGMDDAVYFQAEREIPRMAHGYILRDTVGKKGGFREYDYGEENFFATKADGGIYASTHEFALWQKALRDDKVISSQIKQMMHSPYTKVSGSPYSDYQNREDMWYALGWFLEQKKGMPKKVYHTGDNGGFQIYAGFFPEKDLHILVFENRNDMPRWALVEKLDEIALEAGWLD